MDATKNNGNRLRMHDGIADIVFWCQKIRFRVKKSGSASKVPDRVPNVSDDRKDVVAILDCKPNFKPKGARSPARPITVVDAMMGRGKTSAAIRHMNQCKGGRRFLYVTPYLDEVSRVCELCGFEQPGGDGRTSKSAELKRLMRMGASVAATHSLFYLMDGEALELARGRGYSLVIDESVQVIGRVRVCAKDLPLIVGQLADEEEDGALRWRDGDYSGRFSDYKELADAGRLYHQDTALLDVMNPALLGSFDEVFMLTYMFDGQYQKAYLDFFGLPYRVVGVGRDGGGCCFSDAPDEPPRADYRGLVSIVGREKMNRPGAGEHALSKSWFSKRGYDDADVRALRGNLRSFFQHIPGGGPGTRLWTTFKEDRGKLVDARTGRFGNNFLQIGARATNEYRGRTDVAYLANRFVDPNLAKFFAQRGVKLDSDRFALAEMLQWVWRSAIRDGRPINLYVPSERMRGLLVGWIDDAYQGGGNIAQAERHGMRAPGGAFQKEPA